MAGVPPRINEILTIGYPIYDNDGDPVTAAAGLDSEISQAGGAFADATNEAIEIAGGRGVYELVLTAAEMNNTRLYVITISSTVDSKDAVNVLYTQTRAVDDLAFPTVAGRSIDVLATGEVGIDLDNAAGALGTAQFDAAFFTAALFAADAITASVIEANAIGASELATDAIGSAQIAADAIGASEIATDAIDADALAADAVTEIRSLVTGTADSGTATTMVDAARTEADDVFIGNWILFTSGAIVNQVRLITEFVAATDTMTFAPAVTAAVGTETYEILPAGAVDIQSWLGLVSGLVAPNALIAGRVDSDVGAMQADVVTAAAIAANAIGASELATDAIGSDQIAADAIGASEIATDAIGAAEFATGAVNEIRDAILSDSTAFAGANIDAAITSRATPAQVNTEVVDVLTVDTIAELAQAAPTATPTVVTALMLLYMALRNRMDIDTGGGTDFKEIYNDAGVVITKKTLTDDGTVYSEAEMATGP